MKHNFKSTGLVALALTGAIFLGGCSGDNDVKSDSALSTGSEITASQGSNEEEASTAVAPENEEEKNSGAKDEKESLSSADESKRAEFEKCIAKSFEGFSGKYSYAFHLYDQNICVSFESKPHKSASIIKLFIMEYAYNLIEKGEIKIDTLVGGQSVRALIEAMITYSDNNAANKLIDHFSMEEINKFITSCGYKDTILARKMLDTAAAARGEENYTSVDDVMKMLDKIYSNKNVYPYSEMLSVLKRQQISTKIRRHIPSGVEIASKTGELSDTDNDAAIIFTDAGDFAFVCFTSGASPEPARGSIANAAKGLYDLVTKNEAQ